MAQFRVSWEIDIEAGTAEQAARCALAIQRDPQSTATTFVVRRHGACPSCKTVVQHRKGCPIGAREGHLVGLPRAINAARLEEKKPQSA